MTPITIVYNDTDRPFGDLAEGQIFSTTSGVYIKTEGVAEESIGERQLNAYNIREGGHEYFKEDDIVTHHPTASLVLDPS